MSKQTTEEMKAALDAFERDGSVQTKRPESKEWVTTDAPVWNFDLCEYRPCPPKPAAPRKPRECVVSFCASKPPKDPWGCAYPTTAYLAHTTGVEHVHMREVLVPDAEPQPVDRTPWVAVGSAVLCDGEHLFHAESRNSARRAVDAHNRAIGITSKEEQA